jgi:hypothetical protein
MSVIEKMRGMFRSDKVDDEARQIQQGRETMSQADPIIEEFELEVIPPEPEADTFRIKLDRELAPGGTHFFETQQ